ncbi:MAG: DUF721 domain-containing protein [Nitrospirae bacterium]|nr:DUF721 domain-containing protein [Nitrospirota bacterium]
MKKLSVFIPPILKGLGIEDGAKLAMIKKEWRNLFNEPLSLHMSPSMLSEGEILLNVDSPAWLQQLNFYKKDIIKKMGSYGVRSVRFRLGKVSKKSEVRSQKSEVRRLTHEELTYIGDTVSSISDQELRDKIRKAIEKSIITGRTKNKVRS